MFKNLSSCFHTRVEKYHVEFKDISQKEKSGIRRLLEHFKIAKRSDNNIKLVSYKRIPEDADSYAMIPEHLDKDAGLAYVQSKTAYEIGVECFPENSRHLMNEVNSNKYDMHSFRNVVVNINSITDKRNNSHVLKIHNKPYLNELIETRNSLNEIIEKKNIQIGEGRYSLQDLGHPQDLDAFNRDEKNIRFDDVAKKTIANSLRMLEDRINSLHKLPRPLWTLGY